MFDWKESSLESCATQIDVSTPQAINSLLRYYTLTENNLMVDKIKQARLLAKKKSLQAKIDELNNNNV